jgi:hypothetical protein
MIFINITWGRGATASGMGVIDTKELATLLAKGSKDIEQFTRRNRKSSGALPLILAGSDTVNQSACSRQQSAALIGQFVQSLPKHRLNNFFFDSH